VQEEFAMNWDRVEGSFRQWRGKMRVSWGTLTNDYLMVVAGKRDQRFGRVQLRHGKERDDVGRLDVEGAGSTKDRTQGS
jgi:uncharacterized protein YjbJ (UPF0337 family)